MPTSTAIFNQVNGFLTSPQAQKIQLASVSFYSSNLGSFQLVSVLITALLVAATVFFIIKTGWAATRIDRFEDVILKSDMPKNRSIKAWQKIENYFFNGDDNALKLAVLEADNLLDEALKLAGFRGENLGDRLKQIDEAQLANIQDLWEAHKLRNRLVHEMDFKLSRDLAEKALTIYEQTFKDLGLLD
jgi:hypothetical protein